MCEEYNPMCNMNSIMNNYIPGINPIKTHV